MNIVVPQMARDYVNRHAGMRIAVHDQRFLVSLDVFHSGSLKGTDFSRRVVSLLDLGKTMPPHLAAFLASALTVCKQVPTKSSN